MTILPQSIYSLNGYLCLSKQYLEIQTAANMAAVKVIENDIDFQKQIKANKFVLAIFMEDDTEIEVSVKSFIHSNF